MAPKKAKAAKPKRLSSEGEGPQQAQSENPFPFTQMDYGEDLVMTKAENDKLQADLNVERWRKPTEWTPMAEAGPKRRKLKRNNGLNQSELHLEDLTDPKDYWTAVMKIAPPKQWTDKHKVMTYLASTKPLEKQSNTKIWIQANTFLDKALAIGAQTNWSDDTTMTMDDSPAEFWEALRIIGDANLGFGTFPSQIRERILDAGFAWIAVNPRKRVIPKCWAHWAKKHNFKYKNILPIAPATQPPVPPPMGPIQTSAQLTHMVDIDPDTDRAFNTLKNKVITYHPAQATGVTIQRPKDQSETWPIIEANMAAIIQQQQDLHNETIREVQEFVAKTIQSTVLGPIDGQIRLILQIALDKFMKVNHKEIQGYVQEVHKLKHEIASMREHHDTMKRKFDEMNQARKTEGRIGQDPVEPEQKRPKLAENTPKTTPSILYTNTPKTTSFVNLLEDNTPNQQGYQNYNTIFGDGSGRKSSLATSDTATVPNIQTSHPTPEKSSLTTPGIAVPGPSSSVETRSKTGRVPHDPITPVGSLWTEQVYTTASSNQTNSQFVTPNAPKVGNIATEPVPTTLKDERIHQDVDQTDPPVAGEDQQAERDNRDERIDQDDVEQEDTTTQQLRHFDQDLWD
ncbi:hypothetical protein F4861DRAFT_543006 [Xylaria intraflava]|nr:hypothetical protein F4861DRAFT_543006 [Xylaria intraflava]